MSNIYKNDIPKKMKKWYQYEIMQKSGGLRSFYFTTAMRLNVFRNKTRERIY